MELHGDIRLRSRMKHDIRSRLPKHFSHPLRHRDIRDDRQIAIVGNAACKFQINNPCNAFSYRSNSTNVPGRYWAICRHNRSDRSLPHRSPTLFFPSISGCSPVDLLNWLPLESRSTRLIGRTCCSKVDLPRAVDTGENLDWDRRALYCGGIRCLSASEAEGMATRISGHALQSGRQCAGYHQCPATGMPGIFARCFTGASSTNATGR